METTVFCPDCGGVVGGDGSDGRKACDCFAPKAGPLPGMPDPAPKLKPCFKCGKELTGRKRFKDRSGNYWCEACHFSEKRHDPVKHVPCDGCGRLVEPRKLTDYENIRICTRCLKERRRINRKARRPVVFGSEHREHEKKNVLRLLIVAGVLLLIMLLASLGWLPSLL